MNIFLLKTSSPELFKKGRSKENSKYNLGFKSIIYFQRPEKLIISEEQNIGNSKYLSNMYNKEE